VTAARIAAIFRYPIKSMLGEQVGEARLGERGLEGDRAYAIIERQTGFVASAKHPRKWQRLLACQARYEAAPRPGAPLAPVIIHFPDGATVRSDAPDVDEVLSAFLGRAVSLVASAPEAPTREADRRAVEDRDELIREEPLALGAPAGTFFDHAPVHVVSTTTLRHLADLHGAGCVHARRFRPNLVIDDAGVVAGAGFVEAGWLGGTLRIGARAELRVVDPTPRCVVVTLAHGEVAADPALLRTLAHHSTAPSLTFRPGVLLPAVVGAYGIAAIAGPISEGEVVTFEARACDE
jgi:uncharacterized protein YcbX